MFNHGSFFKKNLALLVLIKRNWSRRPSVALLIKPNQSSLIKPN